MVYPSILLNLVWMSRVFCSSSKFLNLLADWLAVRLAVDLQPLYGKMMISDWSVRSDGCYAVIFTDICCGSFSSSFLALGLPLLFF